jgi:hypothetical protein
MHPQQQKFLGSGRLLKPLTRRKILHYIDPFQIRVYKNDGQDM